MCPIEATLNTHGCAMPTNTTPLAWPMEPNAPNLTPLM